MKKILIRLAIILFGILFGLLLIEVSLRIIGTERASYTQPDRVLGLSYTPGAWYKFNPPEGCPGWGSEGRINSHGIRDYEYDYQKPSGTFRILALGDSFTEGMEHPLENTWTKLLEQQLNARGDGIHFEVINAGVRNVGTSKEYLFYTNEGYRYTPDMVILQFDATDIADNSQELRSQVGIGPFFTADNGQLVLDDSFNKSNLFKLKTIVQPFRANSYLANLVGRVVLGQSPPSPAYSPEQQTAEVDKAIQVTQLLLEALNDAVQAHGARLVFFSDREGSVAGPGQVAELLTNVSQSRGIPYLNLYPEMDKIHQATGEYMFGCSENNGEGHWSLAGTLEASKLIYEFLVSQRLLP